MKVLLKEDVDNLGYAGEVLQVADGYGRNYLIPRGLAMKATAGVLKQAHSWRERAAVRLAELRSEHEALSLQINNTILNFYARAGETGKLYGSITTGDITDELNEMLGTDVDRRHVIGGALRQLGEHRVAIRLSRDYQPQILVQIHPHTEVDSEEIESEEDELEAMEAETMASEVETAEDSEEIADMEESSEETEIETDESVTEEEESSEVTEIEPVESATEEEESSDETEIEPDETATEEENNEEEEESEEEIAS